jgi:PAS domain S-box-containing protein
MNNTGNQDRHEVSWDSSNHGELHRVLFEEADEGIFITDPHGRYVAVNLRGTELTGYSCEELLGMTITDLVPPEDLARYPSRTDELRQGKIMIKERRIRHKDGSLLPVEIRVRMLHTGNLLSNMRDISKRKQAEKALQDLSSHQDALLAAIPDIIMEVDTNKVYTWANQAGLDFFGEGVIGKEAAYYFEGVQNTYEVVEPLFRGGSQGANGRNPGGNA